MADYHPLIARAVGGLEVDTAENRRALYERARTALVTQLRSTVPPLEEAVITRERLALEEAIRKVEMECLRRARMAPKPDAFAVKRPAETERREAEAPHPKVPHQEAPHQEVAQREAAARREEEASREKVARREEEAREDEARREEEARRREESIHRAQAEDAAPQPAATPVAPDDIAGGPVPQPAAKNVLLPARFEHEKRVDEALAELRKVDGRVADAEPVESAPAGPEAAPLQPVPDAARVPSTGIAVFEAERSVVPAQRRNDIVRARQPFGVVVHDADPYEGTRRPPRALRSYRRLAWAGLVILVALGAGALVYWQGDAIGTAMQRLIASVQSPPQPAPQAAAPTRKNTDRVGQPDAAQPAKTGAIGSQRAMLTTEPDPANPGGRDFVGTANWRLEQIPAAPGRPAEVAIRLEVEIPDRGFGMTWLIRRNTDPALPATHTIDIEFKIAPNSPLGTISEIRSMLMKQPGQNDEGAPLWGHAQKSTPTYFLVGLSAIKADAEHNLKLLKTQPAFDVLLVFSKSGRAFLLIEKGPAGEKVFAEAFAAWKQ